ncbi:MAG: alanine racemase [Candidatus Gottesmanbacteria bacterium]
MLDIASRLFGNIYTPLNRIRLSEKNLQANYHYLSSLNPQIQVAPVLKSNAYGHGLTLIAKMIDKLHPPLICVDSLYEAYELFKLQINTPILIIGYVNPENLAIKSLPFSYAVFDEKTLREIIKYQPQAKIHIFVDTGMHREGITINQLPDFLANIKKYKNNIEGLMSHLASNNEEQFTNFDRAQEIINNFDIKPKWIHLLNSSGLLHCKNFPHHKLGNLCRTGIALYDTKPVLKLVSQLVQIKKINKGDKIGYDCTFTAKKDMTIGILPIGYNDGVDRRLSNIGKVLIGKQVCPIIGRVSMNITTIDISKVNSPKIGQEVVVYSDNPKDVNSIDNVAKIIGTIPYEILIHLHPSIRREVV